MEQDTITAIATPHGTGGLAVVRLSGKDAVKVLSKCWKGKSPEAFSSHSVHLGWILDSEGNPIDQVTATLFHAPNSYTGENVVEISCHGSLWIQNALVARFLECGARTAGPGEFTRRAFLNGRLDLAQAESVGDLIASSSRAAARLAATQLRGDFSRKLEDLRSRLIDLGSLLELELDFSEEDVEFADRTRLNELTVELLKTVSRLASSYKAGNVFKNGVPVVIAGVPNAGKSSLLNVLSGDEKAIVSEIPGTTRDLIEDTVEIEGILFRFIDTAGLRESGDEIESIGIERAKKKIREASLVIHLIDPTQGLENQKILIDNPEAYGPKIIEVVTKCDIVGELPVDSINATKISSKTGEGIDVLKKRLVETVTEDFNPQQELIVTNARHYEALANAAEALTRLRYGLEQGLSADFLAQDLREASHHIGTITGAVTPADLLQTIFSRYCIGK